MRSFAFVAAASLLPSVARAQAAAAEGSALGGLLPLLLIFVIFYFMLIRPQQKRFKQHQQLVSGLKKGDEVVTAGGILGKVTALEGDDHIVVQIAPGVEVKIVKSTISSAAVKPDAAKPAHQEKQRTGDKNDNAAPTKDSIANDN
jgi:preprotein translocase subunit YajC